jgi:hypothetical protein
VVATKCPEPNRYLRGVDPTTGEADIAGRLKRLGQLDDAAKEYRELTPWRDYLLRVQRATRFSSVNYNSDRRRRFQRNCPSDD